MFCKNCGHKVPDGSAFCPSCGTPIDYTNEPSNTNQTQSTYQSQNVSLNEQQDRTSSRAQTSEDLSDGSGKSQTVGNDILFIIGPHKGWTAGCFMIWVGCLVGFCSIIFNLNFYSISYDLSYRTQTDYNTLVFMDIGIYMILTFLAIAVINAFRLYSVDIVGAVALIIMIFVAIGAGLSEASELGYETTFALEFGALLTISSILTIVIGCVFGMVETIMAKDN